METTISPYIPLSPFLLFGEKYYNNNNDNNKTSDVSQTKLINLGSTVQVRDSLATSSQPRYLHQPKSSRLVLPPASTFQQKYPPNHPVLASPSSTFKRLSKMTFSTRPRLDSLVPRLAYFYSPSTSDGNHCSFASSSLTMIIILKKNPQKLFQKDDRSSPAHASVNMPLLY